ncbi:MAG: carboxyl-terminal processing protease [Sphingomonadales bacterium]|jgi:C-terminal processing protease CtpA/Prc|nr:carboxyl-terminal processing protease [Sphingomonadales bacterium]
MRKPGALLSLTLILSSCGGGGGGDSGGTFTGPIASTPPSGGTASCTLRARQDWAASQLREWYLFPETLPASLDPTPYASVEDYIDALTATARAQGRDRFFTFLTSIAQENAFNSSGATAGFGIRLSTDLNARRVFIMEAFEGAPALAAGIDRGTEILAIGTSAADLKPVSDILASGGAQALSDAIGPSTAGLTRLLRVSDAGGTREVNVTKANFDLQSLSPRYGSEVIADRGRKVGYINLRSFILNANQPLRDAFAGFRAQGVTDFIIDMRYNGGGLVSVAELFGDLLGGNRASNDLFDSLSFRPEKAASNSSHFFTRQPESAAPARIAFITTGASASASELMINAMLPYLHANEALIGANTYGKPVGQIAVDRSECDDRFRIIAFALQNAAHQGDYFAGLASRMEASCQAGDDIAHPMGDPQEASTRAALDYLGGQACTPITAGAGITPQGVREEARELLMPDRPSVQQRNLPGSY